MRRPMAAGNWKMNLTPAEGADLARAVAAGAPAGDGADVPEVVLFPAHPLLPAAAEAVAGSDVAVGAQDLHPEASGAFTGSVGGPMLRATGCTWVLVGHSERRRAQVLPPEDDALVGRKLAAAREHGLHTILCIGETLEERRADRLVEVLTAQVTAALKGPGPTADGPETVIAYEPVWAIGTGEAADADEADRVHGLVRDLLADLFGKEAARETRILYGGSVKPDNAADYLARDQVDGVLVGGASLVADDFLEIVGAATHTR